ncbi:hypothetical protein H0H93_006746 [Arthromyces matolae]|nr:hypothetical protein H0H93_006746 [Arthromyces matolae]
MKLATPQDLAGHAAASRRGAIEGALASSIVGLGGSYFLHRRYPGYRSLPLSLKMLGVVILVAPCLSIQAERRGLEYDKSKWEGEGVRFLHNKQLAEDARWDDLSNREKLADWADRHQYSLILGGWASSLAFAGAVISRDKVQTTAQKVVQARMWAQGLTIGLLIVAGALTQSKRAAAAKHANTDHSWRDLLAQQEQEEKELAELRAQVTPPSRRIPAGILEAALEFEFPHSCVIVSRVNLNNPLAHPFPNLSQLAMASLLDLPLSQEKLDEINVHLKALQPAEILEWAVKHIPGLYQTTAFGLTGLVAIDMLSKITSSPPPLIFLDTLYHFPETYELVEEVRARYHVPLHVYKPEGCDNVKDFETKHGEKLWETDEDTYDYLVKVEPARRAYKDLDVKAVITGRRASQGADRASLQPLEVDSTGLLKLNPLFEWNFPLVEWYISENNVPRNKLLDQGYRSVGDWHSTSKMAEGQDERAGRWAGREKSECGLHKDYFTMKAQASNVNGGATIFMVEFGPIGIPPLPTILSREIEEKVYTHRSYHGRPTHVFEDHPSDPSPHNERFVTLFSIPDEVSIDSRFEHLGDTVVGLCVTNLMMRLYPDLHVGPSTKIRAMIVGNSTLADISLRYKLPDRLRLHPAQAITLRASVHVQADVLESYIGGLFYEQGLDAVQRWLDPLFKPYVKAAYTIVRLQHGLALPPPCPPPTSSSAKTASTSLTTIGHLALFNQHLQRANRSVEWIYYDAPEELTVDSSEAAIRAAKTTPVWFVKVIVDGEIYGKGRGNTKRAARNEAAKVGLETLGIFVW